MYKKKCSINDIVEDEFAVLFQIESYIVSLHGLKYILNLSSFVNSDTPRFPYSRVIL